MALWRRRIQSPAWGWAKARAPGEGRRDGGGVSSPLSPQRKEGTRPGAQAKAPILVYPEQSSPSCPQLVWSSASQRIRSGWQGPLGPAPPSALPSPHRSGMTQL